MSGNKHAPLCHYGWIGFWEHVPADGPRVIIHRRQTTHSLMYLARGSVRYRWINRGVERRQHIRAGTVRIDPPTFERNTFIGQHNPAHDYYTLLIPADDLQAIAASEHLSPLPNLKHLLLPDDPELQNCLRRFAAGPLAADASAPGLDEVARRLVVRLHRLWSGSIPEWDSDAGVFDRCTMRGLVDHVDASLRCPPSLRDMASLVALSPSHFAKKFRHSSGWSLQRFVNRRRVSASIQLLQANAMTLAHIALELGFASQSHFTRVFHDATGMTPAKYRKQYRRTVGWQRPPKPPRRRSGPYVTAPPRHPPRA